MSELARVLAALDEMEFNDMSDATPVIAADAARLLREMADDFAEFAPDAWRNIVDNEGENHRDAKALRAARERWRLPNTSAGTPPADNVK